MLDSPILHFITGTISGYDLMKKLAYYGKQFLSKIWRDIELAYVKVWNINLNVTHPLII